MGRACVAVSRELFLLASARPGQVVQVDDTDVPADAVPIGTHYDWQHDQLVVVLQSPALPDVPEGGMLPRLIGPRFRVRELHKDEADCLAVEDLAEK